MTSQTNPTGSSGRLQLYSLTLKEQVPSFKNSKAIARRKNGKPFIRTNDRNKERMQEIIDALPSSCIFDSQQSESPTLTAQQLQYWTALLKQAYSPMTTLMKWLTSAYCGATDQQG